MAKKTVKKDKTFDELMEELEKDYQAVVDSRETQKTKQEEFNKARNDADAKEQKYKAKMYDFLFNQLDLKQVHYNIKDIVRACVYTHNHFGEEVPDEAFEQEVEVIHSEASAASAAGEGNG